MFFTKLVLLTKCNTIKPPLGRLPSHTYKSKNKEDE